MAVSSLFLRSLRIGFLARHRLFGPRVFSSQTVTPTCGSASEATCFRRKATVSSSSSSSSSWEEAGALYFSAKNGQRTSAKTAKRLTDPDAENSRSEEIGGKSGFYKETVYSAKGNGKVHERSPRATGSVSSRSQFSDTVDNRWTNGKRRQDNLRTRFSPTKEVSKNRMREQRISGQLSGCIGQGIARNNNKIRDTNFLKKPVDDVDYSDLEGEDSDDDFPQAGDVIRYDRKRNSQQDDEEIENAGKEREKWKRESPSAGSSLPKLRGEVIYGIGPVHAALRIARRELFCLYVQENMPLNGGNSSKKKDKKALEWILRSAIEKELEVKEISKHDLNMLAENRPHQGLVLDASPLELINALGLDPPWVENRDVPPVWVALDEVQDPQNFGAILRSAYFLGAEGVVVCAKNSAPLSAVVSKASAGAMEVMELRSCKNMMKFLEISAKNGWRVVGATAAGSNVISLRDLPRGIPTILVLGGEGKGLRTNVKMSCNHLVCIPGLHSECNSKAMRSEYLENEEDKSDQVKQDAGSGHGDICGSENFVAVDSLNVSVATGILLHELLIRQSPFKHSPREIVS